MGNETFAKDVLTGLSSTPKSLSSKYFYNDKGDQLFQTIMNLDEYYLTRSEYQILKDNKKELKESFLTGIMPFNLIELGAGDGTKTKVIVKHLLEEGAEFNYLPVDISSNVLEKLESDFLSEFSNLHIDSKVGDYFHVLQNLRSENKLREVVLFLGSNIGNFKEEDAIKFLKEIGKNLSEGDKLLIGFDLKKDPQVILKAYNDKEGVTRQFNLNLLERINEELGGNFELENFMHYPVYDPYTGQARSYIVSLKDQEVYIEEVEKSFSFKSWEPIFVEVSQKYTLSDIERIASLSGFKIEKNLFDKRKYFVDSIWALK